ncbi:MAG: hypothetical protein SV201_11680, partial [Pseudomonadota bacterium]|nr:hypothetical protein [Pseudomonadota bacterium]
MQRYSEIIRDELGNAIADAEVRVFVGDSSALATVYDGDGNTVGQPLTTDSNGLIINGAVGTLAKIGFKATGGRYRLKIKKGADEFELPDVLIGDAQGYDAIDFLSAASDDIFPDTTDGIAATTDGDYFYIADEAGDNLLLLYKNDAGTALELGTLPRASVISGLVDQAEQYRDQIAAFGGYYADTTAGLA